MTPRDGTGGNMQGALSSPYSIWPALHRGTKQELSIAAQLHFLELTG